MNDVHHSISDNAVINLENLSFELQKLRIGFAAGSDAAIRVADLVNYCNPIAVAVKVAKNLTASAICEVAFSRILSCKVRVTVEL